MACILAALALLPAAAAKKPTFNAQQREQIGNIVRDYLLTHPELLDQLAQKRQAQQMQQQNDKISDLRHRVIAQRNVLLNSPNTPQSGPESAKVMVMSFYDYRCLPCGKMDAVIAQLMRDYPQVRFVFRDWPMPGAGWSVSETASAIGVALWQQQGEVLWRRYHQALFNVAHQQGKIEVEDIARVVKALQVAVPAQQAISKARRTLSNNALLAERLQLSNLPTVIVMPVKGATMENTSIFISVVSAEIMQAAIIRGFYDSQGNTK